MQDNSTLFTFLSAVIGGIGVFLLALYKDNRTHKRIDATDEWISGVEKASLLGLKEVKNSIAIIEKNYNPISGKIDDLKISILSIQTKLDDDKKQRIIKLEQEGIEYRHYIKELELKLKDMNK